MIKTPTLLLDRERCKRNIRQMTAKARAHNLIFRPHFKTHQSLEIGRWFREFGTEKITVSSVTMADYFAEEWDDITLAFPVNILEIDKINELASRVQLNLMVENEEVVSFLAENLQSPVGIFFKIEVGNKRTGMDAANHQLMERLFEIMDGSPKMHFSGFLGHAGQTYACRGGKGVAGIHQAGMKIMQALKDKYIERYPNLITSLGDTPSCTIADDYTQVDEIRPGNFVFYDLTQNRIGSNSLDQIAVAMACPIVALHPERNEIVVYGGGVHFSKDRLEEHGRTVFGQVVKKQGNGWGEVIPEVYVKSLSQEHGIISVPQDKMARFRVGDYLLVLPVHSCMTADCMKKYVDLEGREIARL